MVALFVVLTFIIFLVADFFVLKSQKREHPAFASFAVFDKSHILFPAEYLFSKGHIWLKAIQENIFKVGIDEFILKSLGMVKITETVTAGTKVSKGDLLMRASSGGRTFPFYAPVSGTIISVNQSALNRKIESCYDKDWSIAIKAENAIEITGLMGKEKVQPWLNTEFRRLKDFLHMHTADPALAGLTMADGGNIAEGAVSHLSQQSVNEFEQSFLLQ